MAYVESHQAIMRHPKTLRLAGRLGCSKHEAIGVLHALWWWALDYAQDGNLAGFTPGELAMAVEWPGDPATLILALTDAGWLDGDSGGSEGLHIHDWSQYGGKLIEWRRKDADRKRLGVPTAIPSDVQRISDGAPVEAPAEAPAEVRPDPLVKSNVEQSSVKKRSETPAVSAKPAGSKPTAAPVEKPPWAPRNDAERMVQWWSERTGAPIPAAFPKAVSAARRLIAAGITEANVGELYDHCDGYLTGVTLEKMYGQLSSFQAEQAKPRKAAPRKMQPPMQDRTPKTADESNAAFWKGGSNE